MDSRKEYSGLHFLGCEEMVECCQEIRFPNEHCSGVALQRQNGVTGH